jgi:phage gp29-like protein
MIWPFHRSKRVQSPDASHPSYPSHLRPLANRATPLTREVHVKQANMWRDQFNPLRGLTIARAVTLLEAGERGDYADLQWTYRTIEKRYDVLSALLSRHEAGLLKLDWQIKAVAEDELPPGATAQMAEAQQDFLRSQFERITNLRAATEHLIGARFRGFAHLEKIAGDPDEPAVVTELRPVEQWYWVRANQNADWQYNPKASGGNRGQDVPLDKFIIREVSRPVNEIALIAYVKSQLCDKDWDGFIETYGIPPIFLVGPPGANAQTLAAFQSVAEKIIGDARGVLPNGSDIKSADAGERGNNPFKERISELKERVVLAGTGGKLTMLTEATGIGQGATGAHSDAWDDIVQAEAMRVSEILHEQLGAPLLEQKFPEQPPLAYFEWCAYEEATLTESVDSITKLTAAGYQVEPGYVEEKTGMKLAMLGEKEQISLPQFKQQADAYGVAVRAGAITPNLKDEAYFRQIAGLPPVGPEVRAAWTHDPTRSPITIAQEGDVSPFPGRAVLPRRPDQSPLRNRAETGVAELAAAALQRLGAAQADDLQPIRARIAEIRDLRDPDLMRAAWLKLKADLPNILAQMNANPATAKVLADAIAPAVINGMANAAVEQAK